MFSSTNEVSRADAKDQIMCTTNNLRGIPKNESLRIFELLKTNETIGYGCINVPPEMGDALILNTIRYKDPKDIYFKHLTTWFEVDFAWYDKDSKQVMVWGKIENVKDSINDLKHLLETDLHKDLQRLIYKEKENIIKRKRELRELVRDDKDCDPYKHT